MLPFSGVMFVLFLKKNMHTSKPFDRLLSLGEKMSKRLGGDIGRKNKNSPWHIIGFPDGSSIGSTV